MDRLPCEIVHKIFLLAVPKHYISSEKQEAAALSVLVPLYISHVCRSWRSTALSYGPLWSYLCLHFILDSADFAYEKVTRNIDIFYEWLGRMDGTPLNFKIDISVVGDYDEAVEQLAAEYIIKDILSLQETWKDVNFEWTGLSPSSTLVRINAYFMPLLSSMVFRYETRDREDPPIIIDLSNSLRVKRIFLRGHLVLWSAREPILTQLKGCVLEFCSSPIGAVAQSLQVLKLAPNLGLFMSMSDERDDDAPRLAQNRQGWLMHPVRRLYFELPYSADYLIDQITTPSLELLSYRGTSAGDGGIALLELIQRSRPALTSLNITGNLILDTILAETLRLLPALSELRIPQFNLSSQILQDLTLTQDPTTGEGQGHVLCPELESFSISYQVRGDEEFSEFGALIQMVQSRIEFTKTLNYEGLNGVSSRFANVGRVTKLDEPNVDWNELVLGKGTGLYVLNFFGERGHNVLHWDFYTSMCNTLSLNS